MAQTERTAKSVTWSGLVALPADIAYLRNVIASGQTITAENINTISTLLNYARGHYHTYDDAYQLATFGNNGDRNNYYVDKNTSNTGIGVAPSVTVGNTITASDHNSIRNVAEALRTHNHTIDDRTS